MSTIVNQPKVKNPLIHSIRDLFEHRALWLYYLYDEATKTGMDPELLPARQSTAAVSTRAATWWQRATPKASRRCARICSVSSPSRSLR